MLTLYFLFLPFFLFFSIFLLFFDGKEKKKYFGNFKGILVCFLGFL